MNIFKGFLISSIAMTTFVGTDLILQNNSIHNKVYAESYNVTYKERDSQEERLIVKFKNQIDLPYEDGIEKRIKSGDYDNNLKKLFSENTELTLNRLFSSVNPIEIEKLSVQSKSVANESANNLLNYYIVQAPNNIEIELLLKKFETSPLVEEAYIQEKQILTPPEIQLPNLSVNPYDDPRFKNQGYLEAAPKGINAPHAWNIKGGDGKDTTFVDMEYGWLLNHEDLVNKNIKLMSGQNISQHRAHGTSVLGIVSSEDNQIGNIGIAPKANVKVISQIRDNGIYNTADAILSAVHNLQAGDILLLEAQASYDGYGDKYLPVEVHPDIFDAIRVGADKGIIIIEAGANGSNDLDNFKDRNGKKILNRNSPDFKDSGAIMVGAGSSTVPHKRLWFSNYGSRLDVYGWGENVDTTSANPNQNTTNLYTSTFSGTSSASPIIAGAATSIQGIAKEHRGSPYTPAELRNILSNPNTGTQSQDPWNDRIGVLPDLKSILNNLGFNSDIPNSSSILEGKQFAWSLKGISDFEFAKINFNKSTEEMQIDLKAGVPHHYFNETYASIKVQNATGKVVYNKDIYGNKQQNAESQRVPVKVGDYIELTHLEGVHRATLTNVDNSKQESFGKKSIYEVTKEGLKKVEKMPEATILEGNKFAWSLKGYSDREFAKVDYDKTVEEMKVKLEAGVPHSYFASTYASIKVQNSSGNVLYNKEIVGNKQQNAESQTVPVKIGDYIELTHIEGEATKEKTRATLINLENNKNETIGKTARYQVTKEGLKKVEKMPETTVLDGNQFTWSLKGYNDREIAKVEYNKATEKMQIKLEAGIPHSYFTSTYASIKVQNSSGNILYNKEIVGNRQQNAESQTVLVKVGDYIEFTHIEGEAQKEKTRATLTNLENSKQEFVGKKKTYQVTPTGLLIK
ncbi:putative mucin/carbohydrate-binding domain-containing protein [Bacillus cereus]|uniref:putative mucin/carbohydrate-binding domain-containing protein n=1 Tax=Bacillus cereus TaxID=1396 RepID=UPI0024073D20|nr:putative mucin/carbohydrate-binding domain-containing protein [Bacillus cereus]MDF9507274.1 putative mucin/carbohydrate-binding domain-containing protein [Bacillus cereus]MDF9595276.1 putative mucin/carbohydrate-binding domain-containing protein [Bacillus cereus]MDF9609642.1 putative mucin/carbohydrate-binding domain-containing protein [Bacillus cereus]MDF9659641.1 putative mucin/carbohydrate-binding domain-containing protein [Bacillus cereus]